MYIRKANIKNVRGIESINLQFKPGFNLIKGFNGTGKTAILKALSVGLSSFSEGIQPESSRSFSKEDVRKQYQYVSDTGFSKNEFYPVEVDIEVGFEESISLYKKELSKPLGDIHCACISRDRKTLAIGVDGCIEIWNLEDFSFEHRIQLSSHAIAIALFPDSGFVIVALADSTIRTLDIDSGMNVGTISRWIDAKIQSIVSCDDGESVAVCADHKHVRFYGKNGMVTGRGIYTDTGMTTAILVHKDVLYIGTDLGVIEVHSLHEDSSFIAKLAGHGKAIQSLAISDDGGRLVSSSKDETIRIWNVETKECIHVIDTSGYVVSSLSISLDNQALIGGSSDCRIRIWDMVTGKTAKTLFGASWPIVFVGMMFDNQQIVGFGKRDAIIVWDLEKSEAHLKKELDDSSSSTRLFVMNDAVATLANQLYNNQSFTLPVLSYQGAGRVWSSHTIDDTLLTRSFKREDGYMHSLNGISDVQFLLGWCIMMEVTAFQRNTKIIEYEAVKNTVAKFMGLMDHSGHYDIAIDRNTFTPMFTEGNKTLPIHNLSIGYQSLIWMVFDIAFRMAVLNPVLREKIAETPGIVLIDEIDIHLHTRWQWKVMDALRNTFPNVQCIATTHSPILFASSKDVWLIDIDHEEPEYAGSIYGLDISNAADIYQGKYSVPEEIGQMVQQFYEAMDINNYPEAKSIIEKLEKEFTIETPLLVDLKTMYAFESDVDEAEE